MNKKLTLTAILFVLTGATIAATASTAPDLIGLSPDSARLVLAEDSLRLLIGSDVIYTDSIPEGHIAWQEPMPDSAFTTSINVMLAASLDVSVPEVLGVPLMDAQKIVSDNGLVFSTKGRVESGEYPAGTIAHADPPPGSSAKRGDTVTVKVSQGLINYVYVTTSTGVDITLRDRPTFRILSAGVASTDSAGFVLSFNLELSSPYEHSMTAESMRTDLQINRVKIGEARPEMSVDLSPKGKARTNITVGVTYDDISRTSARAMLEETDVRLVGSYKLYVESGFSTKPFDCEATINLFGNNPDIRSRLEEIAGE